MHNQNSIQEILKNSLLPMHQKRVTSLIDMASSLLNGGTLTVSSLGRHLSGKALEKSRIHRADSIIGNGLLNRDSLLISKALVDHFFQHRETLYVLIDGSGCCSKERYILQASIANVGLGRSQPIHTIVYTNGVEAHIDAQDALLKELQFIFKGCKARIVLITDAGFYSSWFNKVRKIGWEFVGRVRGRVKIQREGLKRWQAVAELYEMATNKAASLGKASVGRDKKARSIGTLYLIKKNKKGRKKPLAKQRYPQEERQYAQMYKDPWLLISSLDSETAKAIVAMYALRMQIEQNFRDIKSSQYGFGLEESKTKDLLRLRNLLLIATIATFMAFILGLCAEKCSLHKTFQANTITVRRVLSLVYLGKRVWRTGLNKITEFIQQSVYEFISWDGEIYSNG
jgi:hypothetical protein